MFYWESVSLTQIALHDAGVVQGGVQLDDGRVQPLGAVPVHQLSVDHRGLTRHSSITSYVFILLLWKQNNLLLRLRISLSVVFMRLYSSIVYCIVLL